MKTDKTKALLGLNIGVLVMSMAALFAKLISWHPALIILGRVALATPTLGFYLAIRKRSFRIQSKAHTAKLIGLGIMTITHWITFFTAIQKSSVAVAILAVFTSPIMLTFLEPLFEKAKIHAADLVVALIAFVGIALMIDDYNLGSSTFQGVLFGLISAVLVSLRNIWSKPMVQTYTAPMVLFWQMCFGTLLLLPLPLFIHADVTFIDLKNLTILAVFATALAHSLMLNSIGQIGARATGVIMMIQPLYAIALAAIILGEIPATRVLLGGVLVISASGYESFKQKR